MKLEVEKYEETSPEEEEEEGEKKKHKPGGGKGCSQFEVTMEVPGMQVSRKVDAVLHLKGVS